MSDLATRGNPTRPRVAICFFGIPRSLGMTRDSLLASIIRPIEGFAEVGVFAHFYLQDTIDNPRTGERGVLSADREIVPYQTLIGEAPGHCLELWGFEDLKRYGDAWGNDFASLRNLVSQLHSLNEVTKLAESFVADVVVFARPDLWYYDSLVAYVEKAAATRRDLVMLPYWQPFRGENDRFAIVSGQRAIRAYGGRVRRSLEYCKSTSRPLHSESLVKFAIEGLPRRRIPARAARVRAHGLVEDESFNHGRIDAMHTSVHFSGLPPQLRRIGHVALNQVQRVVDFADRRAPIPRSASGDLLLAYPKDRGA